MLRLTRSCSFAFAAATAVAACHDASSQPARPPKGAPTESSTMTDFAPLPPPPDVPTGAQIADAVAAGVPAAQRPRAAALIRDEIVPWQLRSIASFPKPRRLAEVVYENLVEALR